MGFYPNALASLDIDTFAELDALVADKTLLNGEDGITVAQSGTGRTTATAYAVICGGTTATGAHQSIASVGSSGEVLTSNGAGSLPTFQAGASGDVSKVGTPVDSQIGVWTGDGTIEGDADFTFNTASNDFAIASAAGVSTLAMGGANILVDSPRGTMTLSNIDAIDATTETTLEAAIDSLSNLTTVGTVTSGNVDAVVTDAAADGATKGKAAFTANDFDAAAGVISLDYTNGQKASTTQAGFLTEIATAAETTTGTDAARAVSPDGLAGSDFGKRSVQLVVFDFTTDTATGDGKFYFHVPVILNTMNLVAVHAEVITAGTTNTTDIQINNVTQAADMLSTKLTINSGETGSDTATAAVIDAANDDVATNDLLRIDVDQVSTTPAKGLIVTLDFQLP